MVTILTAVFCIHHLCSSSIISTPVSFSAQSCAHEGYWIALKHTPKNWRVAAYFCEDGRDV